MTPTKNTSDLTADHVFRVLESRGFRVTPSGKHCLAVRDDIRLSLPGHGRSLPADFVRRLDYALEAILGTGWLWGEAPGAEAPERSLGEIVDVGSTRMYVIDAIVTQLSEGTTWAGFLPDDLTIMGTGESRDDALRDLKGAVALWLDVEVHRVVLVTPTVI
jgi:predicted RNase H-like HicB family nuclease